MMTNFYKKQIIVENQKELSIFYSKAGWSRYNLIESLKSLIREKTISHSVFRPCIVIFGDSIIDSSFYDEIFLKLKENKIHLFVIRYPHAFTNIEDLYRFIINSILEFLYENQYEILHIYVREQSKLIKDNGIYKLSIFNNILYQFNTSVFFDMQLKRK